MKASDNSDTRRSIRKPTAAAIVLLLCLVIGLIVRHLLLEIAGQEFAAPHRQLGNNAPYITSPDLVVDQMIELAGLDEDDLVFDLGCGDGRIVIAAAQQSGCRGVGFEIDPKLVAQARENVRLEQVDDRVEIVEQDIFTVDLSEADVAMMYLLPWMMNKLVPQFDQMRPGCRIISHEYWIEGVEPDEVLECEGDMAEQPQAIYLYTTPLKRNPLMERGTPPVPGNLAPK